MAFLHLDIQDLEKFAAAFLPASVEQKDGDIVVSWGDGKFSASLRTLKLAGTFTFDGQSWDVDSIEITPSGVNVKFAAKSG